MRATAALAWLDSPHSGTRCQENWLSISTYLRGKHSTCAEFPHWQMVRSGCLPVYRPRPRTLLQRSVGAKHRTTVGPTDAAGRRPGSGGGHPERMIAEHIGGQTVGCPRRRFSCRNNPPFPRLWGHKVSCSYPS